MDAHYRVTIFGSARIQEGDQEYQDVFTIASRLAEAGQGVVTGGGPGKVSLGSISLKRRSFFSAICGDHCSN